MSVRTGVDVGLDHVAEFATAAEWFAVTVAGADLRAPVPTCPGWTVHDLVVHLGNVHSWAATIVETGELAADLNDAPGSRKGRAVAEWYAGKAEDLYEALRAVDPARSCWNFAFGTGTAGFWRRRQMHETTVHAADLALATGRTLDVRPEIAADGVDEVLTVFLHRMHARGHPAALTRPLSIVATDTGASWTLTPRAGESFPTQPSGEQSVAGPPRVRSGVDADADRVSGPASALDRLLWKRLPADDPSLSYAGDRPRIDAFLASRLTA